MLSNRIRPDVEAAPWVIEEIKHLEQQLASLTKGVKIQIPSNTLEQEFSSWHRRGYNKAKDEMHQEVERLKAEISRLKGVVAKCKVGLEYAYDELKDTLPKRVDTTMKAQSSQKPSPRSRRKDCE